MGTFQIKEPFYVCIHVPEFPAQSLIRLRPELQSSPVAILAGDPPFEQVCSINAYASRLGVVKGMSRAELEGFANLQTLLRSEQEELNARSALLGMGGTFTPRIEVQPCLASNFAIVLDMSGTTCIFGPPEQTMGKIATAVKALSFYGQLAASANLHAATCVAASARKNSVVMARGQEAEHLRKLPLSTLPLTVAQAETFLLWGLRTLGDLADLPEAEVSIRLGQEGRKLWLLARGEHSHLLVPEESTFLLEEFLVLDSPVELLDSLLFVIRPMLDQLLVRAQNRALALASVTIKLALDGGGEHVQTIKPALPVVQCNVLLKLLHLDLQAHPPSAGVLSVFVQAEPGDSSKTQLGMFAPQLPEPLRLDVTLARIAAIVGKERVGRPKLQDTHRPDSFKLERFNVPTACAKEEQNARAIASRRRCRPPIVLSVKFEGQHLTAFSLRGKPYAVKNAWGPWRKSGNWWSRDVWSQEEWDVHAIGNTEDTLLCLLTHDLLLHYWHLEALYD